MLEDSLASIPFTHVAFTLQGWDEGFTTGPLAVSTTGLRAVSASAIPTLELQRLAPSADMLEMASEDKNMLAALATTMLRTYKDMLEVPVVAVLGPLPPGSMKAVPASAEFLWPKSAPLVAAMSVAPDVPVVTAAAAPAAAHL